MIERADLAQLSPAKRAEVIYATARSELSGRLWRAALGDADSAGTDRTRSPFGSPAGLADDSLFQLLGGSATAPRAGSGCACACHCDCHNGAPSPVAVPPAPAPRRADPVIASVPEPAVVTTATRITLGPNARYTSVLASAEAGSGVPAATIAAIVDAEAGKNRDGSWNPHSRNPRSSAAGLGQFLSGTWQDMAQRDGTWLNQTAQARGWLDGQGRVRREARSELLALRYDPEASIRTVADFARNNLDRLERSGLNVRADSETVAKAAYLSHHLGLGDAARFLGGGIDAGRARMLLSAQIGSSAAAQRIAQAGGATQAHRQWLLGYIDRNIRPDQFQI